MIYLKCPSCGTVIGNRQIMYENGLSEIMDNKNTNNTEKLELKTKLLNELGLSRYCCKMRVITYINLPNIVK